MGMMKCSSLRLYLQIFSCLWLMQMSFCSAQRQMLTINSSPAVQLREVDPQHIVIDNGIVQVTLSKPKGFVTGVKYNGFENVLASRYEEDERGYWDIVWYNPGSKNIFDKLQGTNYKVIMQNEDQVEVSFIRKWDVSVNKDFVPLNIDKRYIVRRGSSGFYTYTIMERLQGWPDVNMDQIRIVFKLPDDKFTYMAISDNIQRIMPTLQDRDSGEILAYPEAVLLTHPKNPALTGEVDDKYQYAMEQKDSKVHGWISQDPPVGFWMIRPSDEYCIGGPIRQDLTSHVGPNVLSMFTSVHYAGKDLDTQYRNGEPWKKVFGPNFIYLNSISTGNNIHQTLWDDAKNQMWMEVANWPYDFPQSEDFAHSNKRGTVAGQIMIQNEGTCRGTSKWASFAYVGLSAPGDVNSWQFETKGYQFWTQADKWGSFLIKNVQVGNYNLYAWVPGFIGGFKYDGNISITPGSNIRLGALNYSPPRNGPTLWEIGIPDRSAAEFFVPDPKPALTNKLFINQPRDKFREYGLWDRYTDLYPTQDLIYNVATSNYIQDWFFAHVPRNKGNNVYQSTTWQIIFELQNVNQRGDYTLQLALASANSANIEVRFNNPSAQQPLFSTKLIGKDNAIARHGIHGLYWLYSIDVPSLNLLSGNNTLYLTQTRTDDAAFSSIMYDYIRLEGPREN